MPTLSLVDVIAALWRGTGRSRFHLGASHLQAVDDYQTLDQLHRGRDRAEHLLHLLWLSRQQGCTVSQLRTQLLPTAEGSALTASIRKVLYRWVQQGVVVPVRSNPQAIQYGFRLSDRTLAAFDSLLEREGWRLPAQERAVQEEEPESGDELRMAA
ncbi:MAG: hypothetical protein KGL39_21585 [Patescibacteria group bacterium]|nr:hypothetical protein [Patescibacteria group bacterium]